ncbi:MAG: nuclear transport factor 2 family protein [Xanthobacteraceae bacterium]
MSIDLESAIDLYVKAENSGEVRLLADCFASNAVVRDEEHTYVGLASIQQWKAETKKKYSHTVEPLQVTHRDGRTILKAKLAGNFPGSPVTLNFSFVLEGGKIASLDIG